MQIFVYIIIVVIVAVLYSTGAFGDTMYSGKVIKFAEAIAHAEGFGVANAIPTLANNPGDLAIGDLGYGILGKEKISKFPDVQAGWNRLYGQVQAIINGTSSYYRLDMTISDMAYQYTSTDQDAWSENVATYLGVTRDTLLRTVLT